MSADVILHPLFMERLARRMAQAMEVPPGDDFEQERAHSRALDEFGVACDGGVELTDDQWRAVWRRVDALLSAKRLRERGQS